MLAFLAEFSKHFFVYKGSPGFLFNAGYDDENDVFNRKDTSVPALWIDVGFNRDIPGETDLKGLPTFWTAAAGSNPIGSFGASDGWQLGLTNTDKGTVVMRGDTIEIDGNGFVPYGRVVHYTDSVSTPTVAVTGILTNIFGDFSGVDDNSEESYFIGQDHINDRVVIRRWVAGDYAWSDGVNLAQFENDGSVQFIGPFGLVGYTVSGLPAAGSYAQAMVYVSNEVGGAVPAFSDGTNWRRVTDRAVVST